ncbi:protein SODIUM POTASSIUM ROOT DEFECTIVE 3-like [Diospyros lotus]|uniref:protein SODIUM POTASSIUM ROOT DEFECTIVE 3-like n=1 Tax=Diospyros lotus TaxID=55363 RepID=UPI0022587F90|nr:protein SODIUM POTASSIUM ROOT DEFECTIVE 3-like [Diospyros lotus]
MGAKKKKKKGFMCQSVEATAVCMTADRLSVVVPRRQDQINTTKYTRLVESSNDVGSLNKGSTTMQQLPPIRSHQAQNDPEPEGKTLQEPSSVPSPDHIVVMRVSLHCHGCAVKVKRRLSKMEGN